MCVKSKNTKYFRKIASFLRIQISLLRWTYAMTLRNNTLISNEPVPTLFKPDLWISIYVKQKNCLKTEKWEEIRKITTISLHILTSLLRRTSSTSMITCIRITKKALPTLLKPDFRYLNYARRCRLLNAPITRRKNRPHFALTNCNCQIEFKTANNHITSSLVTCSYYINMIELTVNKQTHAVHL